MGCQILQPYRNAGRPQVNRKCYGLRAQKSTRGENYAKLAVIMAVHHGMVTRVCPELVVRFGTRRFGPPASPLDFSARSRIDLLFRVFLTGLSNSWIDGAPRIPSCQGIFPSRSRTIRPSRLLVCADPVVAFK